jgi:hypothetical protein
MAQWIYLIKSEAFGLTFAKNVLCFNTTVRQFEDGDGEGENLELIAS